MWEFGGRLGLHFVVLSFLFTISNCSEPNLGTSVERIEEGGFDLRQVDFQKDGLFELRQGWRYYPNRLLLDPPESISDFSEPREGCIYQVRHEMSNPISKQTNLKKPFQFSNNLCGNHVLSKEAIPILRGEGYSKIVSTYHTWDKEVDETGKPRSRFGYAVYSIALQLVPGKYGIFEENWPLSSSGRVWIYQNGSLELLQNIGYPSHIRESNRAMWLGVSKGFSVSSEDVMILVEVANYYHRVGTLGYSLNLGNRQYIQKKHISYIQEEMVVFGLILMVGFYNLILFLLRKDQKAAFWFSLFCLSIALRILLVSRFFQYQYPNADHFDLLLRLEYFTFSTSAIFMVLYIQNLMKSQVNRVFRTVSVLYCLFITLIVFLTPTEFFSNYLLAVMLCAVLVIV